MKWLYHATDKNNLKSIKENGLLINPLKHAYADEIGAEYLSGKIFLALNAEAAEAYAENADECPEEIAVLKISCEALHEDGFGYDENNKCECRREINSCIYTLDIPADFINECHTEDEPDQDIDDFSGTSLYRIILDAFYDVKIKSYKNVNPEKEINRYSYCIDKVGDLRNTCMKIHNGAKPKMFYFDNDGIYRQIDMNKVKVEYKISKRLVPIR